jgi:peptidoglycan/xylan/chitin deacetylase (PgdA/CDA1 family)
MYHSISGGQGPTCLAAETFRMQLTCLADCGYEAVSLAEYLGWQRGERCLVRPFVVLTFDDAFDDFADVAFPELRARGWSATVFVPAGKVGGADDWERGHGHRARRLMAWDTLRALTREGVDLGAHGMTHVDLTAVTVDEARREIVGSKHMIEELSCGRVSTFSYPYGRSNRHIRTEVGKHYAAGVGTVMGRVGPDSDRYDLPRIEMWYFRDLRRWRDYLEGRNHYLRMRSSRASPVDRSRIK